MSSISRSMFTRRLLHARPSAVMDDREHHRHRCDRGWYTSASRRGDAAPRSAGTANGGTAGAADQQVDRGAADDPAHHDAQRMPGVDDRTPITSPALARLLLHVSTPVPSRSNRERMVDVLRRGQPFSVSWPPDAPEAIALAAHRDDDRRRCRVALQLAPQALDEGAQVGAVADAPGSPDPGPGALVAP